MEKEIEIDKNKVDDVGKLKDECENELNGNFKEKEKKLICNLGGKNEV